jgi:predicted CoA-binding protein
MKTLVVGASTKPERYSNMAIRSLLHHGHEVVALGLRKEEVMGVKVETDFPEFNNIDTVTLYLNPQRQKAYYTYLLSLNPRRIIFNPGTENPAFMNLAREQGVEVVEACTLVLLSTNQFA